MKLMAKICTNKLLKSVSSHVAVHPIVLGPLLNVVAIHPVVLLIACFYFHQLFQLVDAVPTLAVLMRPHILLYWVELWLKQKANVSRIFGGSFLDDHCLGETL